MNITWEWHIHTFIIIMLKNINKCSESNAWKLMLKVNALMLLWGSAHLEVNTILKDTKFYWRSGHKVMSLVFLFLFIYVSYFIVALEKKKKKCLIFYKFILFLLNFNQLLWIRWSFHSIKKVFLLTWQWF